MYLLDSQQAMDLLSRDHSRAVFRWLREAEPRQNDLFVSVLSMGQIAQTIEGMAQSGRNHWRRLLQEGRRAFEEAGSIVSVDMAIVEIWQHDLRGAAIADIPHADDELGEDDRLIIATAIARNCALVTTGSPIFAELLKRTSLTLVEL